MRINTIWYKGIYQDVKNAKVSAVSHFLNYGIKEDRIPSSFVFRPKDIFKYKLSSCLYILFLLNESTFKLKFISLKLKTLISFIQYLQLRHVKFDLIVVLPWLKGGVAEAFEVYRSIFYASRKVFKLQGLKSVSSDLESPMQLTLDNEVRSSFLLFFPAEVVSLLANRAKIRPIHFHHFFDITTNFIKLLKIPNFRSYFFVHDYYLFSKMPHLYNEVANTRLTLSTAMQDFPNNEVPVNEVILNIDFFIFPSKSVQRNMMNLIPASKQIVLYPPEVSNIESNRVSKIVSKPEYKVLILGHLGNYKGLQIVREVISISHAQRLKFKFIHIGDLIPSLSFDNYVNVSNKKRSELPQIISELRIDFAWLPFQCEETYSFTLSDIFHANLPLISTKIGCIPERCLGRTNTLLLNPNLDGNSILGVFRDFVQDSNVGELILTNDFTTEDLLEVRKLRIRNSCTYEVLF